MRDDDFGNGSSVQESRLEFNSVRRGLDRRRDGFGLILLLGVIIFALTVVFQKEKRLAVPVELEVAKQARIVSGSNIAALKRLGGAKATATKTLEGKSAPSDEASGDRDLIRVNVTPGGVKSLELSITGPYSIRDVGSVRERSQGRRLDKTVVESTKQGLRIGDTAFDSTRLEIEPQSSPSIRVNGHLYRGIVRLHRRTDGLVSAVNVLSMEEYLASVVDSEMPSAFPEEARQAQAIVARTYASYQKMVVESAAVYDVFASQRSQKYLGMEYISSDGRRLAGESESSRRAVAATRGIVCHFHGKLFCTYYSACCGGRTTDGREVFEDASPVLSPVICRNCVESKFYRWKSDVGVRDFLKSLKELGPLNSLSHVHQLSGPGDGTISQFRLTDGRKRLEVSGIELRERLPSGTAFSPHFRISINGDEIQIDGRGHGHGVGMCQWGAAGLAREGRSCEEILQHYYPGVKLVQTK